MELLRNFVEKELNQGNTFNNANLFTDDFFVGGHTERVSFNRNHRALYNKLLIFCAENDLTVVSTHPATLATIIRIEDR